MPALLDKKEEKEGKSSIILMLIALALFVWLIIPSSTKFLRLQYAFENISYFIATKQPNNDRKAYDHYRANATYMVKLKTKDSKKAIMYMDKAIESVPKDAAPRVLGTLYEDRALIKLYYGDKKGALEDYASAGEFLTSINAVRAAILSEEERKFEQALEFCKKLFHNEKEPLMGYVCLGHVYIAANSPMYAIDLYTDYIDKHSGNAQAYVERAIVEKKINDMEGYDEDIASAKKLSPDIDINKSVLDNIMDLKLENKLH